jgi:hypothetical protein
MRADELEVRAVKTADRALLEAFSCSSGEPWEDLVEEQVRGPLMSRYMSAPPYFDGRMLLGLDSDRRLLVLGAHHIEPTLDPDVGYTEVIAVALDGRGTLIELPKGETVSLGHFMLLTIFQQMRRLRRHPRTFVRVDPRNTRSLALLDRAGLTEERQDPHDPQLVQRWGELP